jgi:hypothetical protein
MRYFNLHDSLLKMVHHELRMMEDAQIFQLDKVAVTDTGDSLVRYCANIVRKTRSICEAVIKSGTIKNI